MEFGMRADALGRVLDEHALRVPHAIRLQARQAIGNQLRQHRQHAVGQVDARATVVGLAVQGRPRADEVRNVGNVDAQPPMAVVEPLQRDGVVEIAGVDRIDGDDRLRRSGRGGRRSTSSKRSASCRASSRASLANSSGRLNSRMIESVSTPGRPCGPSTSTITPSPSCTGEGKRIISMTTLSSGRAFFAPGSPT